MQTLEFVYVTYIATTPEKIWNAIIDPPVTTKYWQHVNVSDWKPGSRWEHRRDGVNGEVLITGKIIESAPPRRLVITWAFLADESKAEKYTKVAFDIEPIGDVVRLTVTHDQLEPGSEMLDGITDGWPKVLSSLKSYLEVGKPLPRLW